MQLNLANYEQMTREAIQFFWENRESATRKQIESGKADQGERSGVTAGKNMNKFLSLIQEIIQKNGLLKDTVIYKKRAYLALPGFFRPTKRWDLLVIYKTQLIAAIELKSHIGPSFGNNFNNRVEEAIGNAHDLWTAFRENAFGEQPRPFVGWLMMVEDAPESRRSVKEESPHFPIFDEFKGASYLDRYNLLCQKMMQEGLCTTATVIAASRTPTNPGEYSELSDLTGMKTFVTKLAGHVAAEAARLG